MQIYIPIVHIILIQYLVIKRFSAFSRILLGHFILI